MDVYKVGNGNVSWYKPLDGLSKMQMSAEHLKVKNIIISRFTQPGQNRYCRARSESSPLLYYLQPCSSEPEQPF